MKKLILLLSWLTFCYSLCNAQGWDWGKGGKPASYGYGYTYGVAVDKYGSAYVTGSFSDTLSFAGNIVIGNNPNQMYLVKYAPWGGVYWAKKMGGARFCGPSSIAVDASDNVYVTGSFVDTLIFSTDTLIGIGNYCTFLVKYDNNGNLLWARQSKSATKYSFTLVNSIAVDASGNVYLTGGLSDTVSFGACTFYGYYNYNYDGNQVFLIKYSASGNVLWGRQSLTPSAVSFGSAYSVTTDASGNVYLSGVFHDTLSFGASSLHTLASTNSFDMFLTKYDVNGNMIWARQSLQASTSSYGYATSATTDASGGIYVTGVLDDTLSFGAHTLLNNNQYTFTFFLVKYNSSGNVVWAKNGYPLDTNSWQSMSIVSDTLPQGGAYVVIDGIHSFTHSFKLKFDADTFKLPTRFNGVTLMLKFDSAGKVQCSTIFSEGNASGRDFAGVDHSGENLYIAGNLQDTSVFGMDTLVQYNTTEPFIAKWQCSGIPSGLSTVENNSSIIVYPNPSNGKFNFEIKSEKVKMKSTVEVYNMLGEKALTQALSQAGEGTQIDLTGRPSGIYLYRVISETGSLISSGKLVIE